MRRHPAVLLAAAALFWAGNSVVARAMRGHVPPVGLAFWRWMLALVILLPLYGRGVVAARGALRARSGVVAAMGVLGVGCFNLFLYLGLQRTTATNAMLLTATGPSFILLLSAAAGLGRPTLRTAAGVLVSATGILVILSGGDPEALRSLRVNPGDLWVLAAVVAWSAYTVLLPRSPPGVPPMVLLTVLVAVGTAFVAPFYAWEIARGLRVKADLATAGAVAYVGLLASVAAYAAWNAGVAAAGPGRAGVALNLIPAFGTVLAVVVLGEPFRAVEGAGILLIGAGVVLVQFPVRRASPVAPPGERPRV
ncbi:MAG TPA: DMT family transporter [Anaeromyxobacteraceae bacterium]|nr:DMT family transporter [Anaeromyxobacteraceae bacterium]